MSIFQNIYKELTKLFENTSEKSESTTNADTTFIDTIPAPVEQHNNLGIPSEHEQLLNRLERVLKAEYQSMFDDWGLEKSLGYSLDLIPSIPLFAIKVLEKVADKDIVVATRAILLGISHCPNCTVAINPSDEKCPKCNADIPKDSVYIKGIKVLSISNDTKELLSTILCRKNLAIMPKIETPNFFDSANKEIHEEADQLKRQKSALSLKMDEVDTERCIGRIKNYEVSLEKCTCVDFKRRQKPCKHMYCLAMLLGKFEIDKEQCENIESEPRHLKKFANEDISYAYSSYKEVPKDFVVLDFETANKSPDSVCQIGIVAIKNGQVDKQKSYLIRPPYKRFIFSDIHGITFEDVKKSPTFADLWTEIKPYLDNQTIAAYNLPFDWRCLNATLNYYQLSHPSVEAFDVLANVKNARELHFENYQLITVAKRLGFTHKYERFKIYVSICCSFFGDSVAGSICFIT